MRPHAPSLLGLTIALLLNTVAFGAESAAAAPASAGQIRCWIEQLGADNWQDREAAERAIRATGPRTADALKRFVSGDPETRQRVTRLLAQLQEYSLEGTWHQIADIIIDRDGQSVSASNSNAKATIEIKRGELLWKQNYGPTGDEFATQVYTFDAATPLTMRGELKVPLTWKSIDTNSQGYSPDKVNPELLCQGTADGLQLVLKTTDEAQRTGYCVFVSAEQQAKAEVERARRAADGVPPETHPALAGFIRHEEDADQDGEPNEEGEDGELVQTWENQGVIIDGQFIEVVPEEIFVDH